MYNLAARSFGDQQKYLIKLFWVVKKKMPIRWHEMGGGKMTKPEILPLLTCLFPL